MPARRSFAVVAAVAAVVAPVAMAAQPDVDLDALRAAYARPTTIPFPASNPYSPRKVELGKTLYFDPRLSRVGALACASCHNASFGWEDGRPKAIGDRMEPVGRHSPTILNLAWGTRFFWDGRAESLEAQAVGPIAAPGEMNLPLDQMASRLALIEGYVRRFGEVFPDAGLTPGTVAMALASFERTVVSGRAPFDAWLEGDEAAIPQAAVRGFALFNDKAGCAICHSGWRFTDDTFHDIGLPDQSDPGRAVLEPDRPTMRHAFKTPGLRNIDQRAPYMHDGSVATLEAVVRHYVTDIVDRESRSPSLPTIELTEAEIADLVAFLRTLTSEDALIAVPVLP